MRIIWILALSLVAPVVPATPSTPRVKNYLMMFAKGEGDAKKFTAAQLNEMQAAHLANLGKNATAKRLLLAGPLQDPKWRGLCVLTVGDLRQVHACFKTDPFVQNRLLKVVAWRWWTPPLEVNSNPADPNAMGQFSVAWVRKGPRWDGKAYRARAEAQTQFWGQMGRTVAFVGDIEDKEDRLQFTIFREKDVEKLRRTLKTNPLENDGIIRTEVIPWFTLKDMF
jgi:uncharacterized protein YciI